MVAAHPGVARIEGGELNLAQHVRGLAERIFQYNFTNTAKNRIKK